MSAEGSRSKNHAGLFFSFIIVASLFSRPMLADHLAANMVAPGKPEHTLAGIDVYKGSIREIIARLGKPTHLEDGPVSSAPKGSGERTYEWIRGTVRLRVATQYYTDKNTGLVVEGPPYAVDLWANGEGVGGMTTGRGLALGDHLDRVNHLYGPRRFKNGMHSCLLQFKDETSLQLDFDKQDRLIHMQLLAEGD